MNVMLRCDEGCSESSNPTRLTTFATPSPSIAERAKCFGTTLSTPRPNQRSSGKINAFKESATSSRALTPRSTVRSVVTGRESLTAYSPRLNTKQSTMKEPSPFQQGSAEPLCPANIVASRRVLFSPGSNAKKPPQAVKISSQKMATPLLIPFRSSPTSDKENSGQGKRSKRFTDISSVQLTEVTKSYSFSDFSPKDSSAPVDDTRRQCANSVGPATLMMGSKACSQRLHPKIPKANSLIDAQEGPVINLSKPSQFEQRSQWLQQRVTKANSFTEPEEADTVPVKPSVLERRTKWFHHRVDKASSFTEVEQVEEQTKTTTTICKETPNNMVAARSMWLQKQVYLHGMPGSEKSTENRRNIVDVPRKKECLPDVATLIKSISPPRSSISFVDQAACLLEAKKTNKLLKKAKNPVKPKKTLVEERAQWLQKQVCRNELHQEVPSDHEEQQEAGQAGDMEQPKSDIAVRLEALKREMAANRHRSSGVAPKKALTELP